MSKLNKEVQAFLAFDTPTGSYKTLRYDLMTCLVITWIEVKGDGSVVRHYPYDPYYIMQYAKSKNPDIKVVLMFGSNAPDADQLLANPTARTTAIQNLLNEVKSFNFDGIDNDVEGASKTNPITNTSNKTLMTAFHTELADTFWIDNPKYRISLDMGGYDWSDIWDVVALNDKTNYFHAMTYINNLCGKWSPYYAINENFPGIDKNKFLLGMGYYVRKYRRTKNSIVDGISLEYISISYGQFLEEINGAIGVQHHWDDIGKIAWTSYPNHTNSNEWYVYIYDEERGLRFRYDLINNENCAGIGIWSISHIYARDDADKLWKTIEDKFTDYNKQTQSIPLLLLLGSGIGLLTICLLIRNKK